MSGAGVAKETLSIVERGEYVAPSGKTVAITAIVEAAIKGTVIYRPADFSSLSLPSPQKVKGGESPSASLDVPPPRIELTPETTAQAARRLFELEGEKRIVALNFASAKNPGGGFLGGAKAQEEDLARCSALYTCQLTQPEYYEQNRQHSSMLYLDYMLYSPDVPFFRSDNLRLLEEPFLCSIITSPAPNAGEARKRGEGSRLRTVLEDRARKVLLVAAHRGHTCLVLGAWGCGVFRNDPNDVADAFAKALKDPQFQGIFRRVVFAIWERNPDRPTLQAFTARLQS